MGTKNIYNGILSISSDELCHPGMAVKFWPRAVRVQTGPNVGHLSAVFPTGQARPVLPEPSPAYA